MSKPLPEVFTLDELIRAAGVSRRVGEALVGANEVHFIQGTSFVTQAQAIEAVPRLWAVAREKNPTTVERQLFAMERANPALVDRRPVFASSLIHLSLLALALWATATPAGTAEAPPHDQARLVFLVTPGLGGGGGGGGTRSPRPASRVKTQGTQRDRLDVPKISAEPREPDPLPSSRLIAPVAAAATSSSDRQGVVESVRNDVASQGPGIGGGAGSGQGTGNGEGLGSGIGDGAGGGTGGGPYRQGSGVEPPRLVREVKADYTDEARRRGVTGNVVLEIVVRRDGSVGDVTLVRGIGAGLDLRAIAAVRQWRFEPARRKGELVDVIVEVAVEFTLR